MPRSCNRPHGGLLQAFCVCTLVPSVNADYQSGLDAYQAGDYATALTEWKEEVKRPGEAENLAIYRESLYAIGMMYWKGEGVEQDYSISAVWLKQAAEINHPDAQSKLGFLYSTGQGVPQNYEQAAKWFEMAAAQGNKDAMYNLDILRKESLDNPQSDRQASIKDGSTAIAWSESVLSPAQASLPAQTHSSSTGEASSKQSLVVTRTASSEYDSGEKWILARNPEHYTIQVIALRQPDNLYAFMEQNQAWSPYAIYRQTRDENSLWVLIQGDYEDVASAREAAGNFPGGLQKHDELWIRRFKMIQGLLE